ncbi:MAG: ATP-grasp domain-containing protein [Methyloversatilis sp.]|nr:ATP-grasp domain-containing protein [Methyloversatilis sp.]MBP6194016.1 ATP-grasp domain-containing protein [Methyloversatilis sp.]MBP9118207.1 ATP-grasp domain-containing protein [Methyloversatilis sp.]
MPHWLIVSGNARAIAQSCAGAGWTCDVVDPFADTDTVALAQRAVQARFDGSGFDRDLPAQVAALGGRWHGVITGSGFERRPELLDELLRFAPLAGNDAATVRRCKTPQRIAEGLRAADVSFAPVRIDGAADAGWLFKSIGGCGGSHVRLARAGEAIPPGNYAQRRIDGDAASVLFLADGVRGRVIGVTRQRPGSVAGPFAWCEAVSDLPLDESQSAAIARDVDAMAREFGLRGLNGADLVMGSGGHVVVEINPRPTATMALYESRVQGGLFAAHVAACTTGMDGLVMLPDEAFRGTRVIYAPECIVIAADVAWPEWCTDRPAAGSLVAEAAPLCTVHATATDTEHVTSLLRERERMMLNMFGHASGQMMKETVFSPRRKNDYC